MRHGTGELYEGITQAIYIGDWENDLPHGYGHVEWLNGCQFTGKVDAGRLAEGSFTFSSGNHYDGNFDEHSGKFSGRGTYSNHEQIIKGEWKDGKLNGKGERKFVNGDLYSGFWVDDHLEGSGSFATKEGKYQGEFHKSLEHGHGTRFYPNGANYKGEWLSGLRNGKGLFKDPNQNNLTYDGYFRNNYRDGFGIETKDAPGYYREG